MKKLRLPLLAALLLVLVTAAALLAYEFRWRAGNALLKPQAAAPGGALVAEVRRLPGARTPPASGVFVRGRWDYLRSLRPQLVFAGHCSDVETRWFGERRLVIECALQSGEPRLLRHMVDGVVIELIVQRQFA